MYYFFSKYPYLIVYSHEKQLSRQSDKKKNNFEIIVQIIDKFNAINYFS